MNRFAPIFLMCLLFASVPVSGLQAADDIAREKISISKADADPSQDMVFRVELAVTPPQRSQGLMHRTQMNPEHGMLFDMGRNVPVSMWMKNTLIPLDMLFIRDDGTIANIIHSAAPQTLETRNSDGPVVGVLELNGGMAKRLGIRAGYVLHHARFGTAR